MDAMMKEKVRARKGFRKKKEQQNDDVLVVHIEWPQPACILHELLASAACHVQKPTQLINFKCEYLELSKN